MLQEMLGQISRTQKNAVLQNGGRKPRHSKFEEKIVIGTVNPSRGGKMNKKGGCRLLLAKILRRKVRGG